MYTTGTVPQSSNLFVIWLVVCCGHDDKHFSSSVSTYLTTFLAKLCSLYNNYDMIGLSVLDTNASLDSTLIYLFYVDPSYQETSFSTAFYGLYFSYYTLHNYGVTSVI